MKKILYISLLLILFVFSNFSSAVVTNSSLYSNIKVYVLYNEENDTYKKEKDYLDENVNIRKEYINTNENNELYQKLKDELKIRTSKLPITVIGSSYFVGYNEKIQSKINEAIDAYDKAENYSDIVDKIKDNEDVKDAIKQNNQIYKQTNIAYIIIIVLVAICCIICGILIVRYIMKKLNKNK